ncbi:uncharacterized protein LOC124701441 [Lolium rigidum]|uniref:uncharacterized protein LOC124701441 n=1 Tax=Lolium rigidum TaxID=89674 RepID=UPI001F5C46AD|nr:uncharacterized protein LOC124701441 [Lolium rigidum]XP_047089456.1 uncharacterized protein LOC124701441 [Lolium rigidum]
MRMHGCCSSSGIQMTWLKDIHIVQFQNCAGLLNLDRGGYSEVSVGKKALDRSKKYIRCRRLHHVLVLLLYLFSSPILARFVMLYKCLGRTCYQHQRLWRPVLCVTEKAVAATNKGLNFSGHTMGTGGLCSRSGRPSAQECPEAHDAPQGCGCLFLMVEKQEQLEFEVALFATTGK